MSIVEVVTFPFSRRRIKKMIRKGDIVFYKDPGSMETEPAIVTRVWSDTCVNLMVLSETQGAFLITSSLRCLNSGGPLSDNAWREGPFVD